MSDGQRRFFSSWGIRALLRWSQALDGRRLRIERASDVVLRALIVAGLDKFFELAPPVN